MLFEQSVRTFGRKARRALSRPGLTWLRVQQRGAEYWARVVDDRAWVHFLHVGKTGGTAVKSAINEGGCAPKHELGTESVCTPSHRVLLHDHSASLKDVPEGDEFFFFLRDPISRFISGFYSRKRKGMPKYYSPWSREEHIAFQRYETPNQLALSLSAESEEERGSAIRAMEAIEHVGDSYSEWYESKQYFLSRMSDAVMVGRVEDLDNHFNQLKSILNLSPKSSLPTSEEEAHKNPYSDLETNLDDKACRNLRDWYKKDYEFLELCEKHSDHLNYPF